MVTLSRLAGQLNLELHGPGEAEICGLTENSRAVRPGWIFAALPGTRFHGRQFVDEALARGAAAVLLSGEDLVDLPVPRILGEEGRLRPLMALAASIIYSRPGEKMILVGLTGTNGKTTTAYLLEAVLKRAGLRPGVMGTVNFRWPGEVRPAVNTTPEGPLLSACLADMVAAGCRSAVLEISSHALALGRVTGLSFEAALFSNLSRDHLDFHQDMESYYQAKKLLFDRHLKPGGGRAVINVDDEYGARLAGEMGKGALTYGFNSRADVRGENLTLSRKGLILDIVHPGGRWQQTSPLLAKINAYNILAAAALALTLRLEPESIRETLAVCPGAPGRLEEIGDDPLVLVDYAHTPEALAEALAGARALNPARLLVLFGCGGDRDQGKRALMGQVAGIRADLTFLTSDNPRTEEPGAILAGIEAGLTPLKLTRFQAGELKVDDWRPGGYLLMEDRRAAIEEAVSLLGQGDVLLIAGKGHEDYQIIGRKKIQLNDRQEAAKALEKAGWKP
ncbi:MAG: UDP-N-acetylmuramoyl-L-alanyl-D-glutamate--2,6-diaminopimelate ligase [Candidatus Adiutrix sp.]|jgi:UDP-N-acetylmuramoyl-L-alanyl-D-glutamate--2,6-diaminopimelate ligase|nr:UDP-N-acetylmuramoyl-L-alanyl-D-glutamate--2,6-diaminopimelate ligase [Candidatus Adiutrix sp.]